MHQFGDAGYQSEIQAHYDRGGQRVNHPALENQVHIHQAVAEDGIAEGEAEAAPVTAQKSSTVAPGSGAHQIRNYVQQRIGNDGKNGPASDPLQLS